MQHENSSKGKAMIVNAKTLKATIISNRIIAAVVAAWVIMMIATGAPLAAQDDLKLNGKPVLDAANIIDPKTEARLNEKLMAFANENSRQMVIITTPSLEDRDIESYSIDLARRIGPGSKELNDGLLLLVAPNERKMRIEVGYGLEWYITDLKATQMIEIGKPFFKEEQYGQGITEIANAALSEITPEAEQRAADAQKLQAERAKENARRNAEVFNAILSGLAWLAAAAGSAGLTWFLATIPKRRRKKQEESLENLTSGARYRPSESFDTITRMSMSEKRRKFGKAYNESEIRKIILAADGRLVARMDPASSEERMIAIKSKPEVILNYKDPTEDELMAAVRTNPYLIADLKNLSEAVISIALKRNGGLIRYVEHPAEVHIRQALESEPSALEYIKNPSADHYMIALRQDGTLIEMVPNPTKEMRNIAIMSSKGTAILQIRNPTKEEDLLALKMNPGLVRNMVERADDSYWKEAVGQDGDNIEYHPNPSEKLQLLAVASSIYAIANIKRPAAKVQARVVAKNPEISLVISNPTAETMLIAKRVKEEQARLRAIEEKQRREREAREHEQAMRRREKQERERKEQARRDEERREQRRREEASSSSSYSSSSSFGSSSGSSSGSDSGFSSGGGSFGGGGASGDW